VSARDVMLGRIFEAVPQAIGVIGTDRIVRFVNGGTERMFGYPRDMLVGRKSRVFYASEEEFERTGRLAHEVLRQHGAGTTETRLRRGDGGEFTALLSLSLLEPGDLSAGLVVVITDISERKRAEETLRASEQRLEMALEVTGACVWDADLPTGHLTLAGALPRKLGYPDEELPRTMDELIALIHPEDRPRALAAYERHLRGGAEVYVAEHRVRRKDGTWCWLSVHAGVVERRPTGVPLRLVGFGVDVSAMKAADAALRQSEERFRWVADFTGQLIYDWDVVGGAVDWCGRVEAITGYTLADVRTHGVAGWTARVHPADRARFLAQLAVARETGHRFASEYRFRHADGTYIPMRGEGAFLYDEAGQPVRMLGTVQDISLHVHAAAEQASLQMQLHQAQKMEAVGQLAGGVAHDFNNLLTVILGSVDVLRAELSRCGGRTEALQAIAEAAEQAGGVTRALLTFSHQCPPEKRVVDLRDVVRRVMKLLLRLMPASVECELIGESELRLVVDADLTQLQQVLINLALNARDAMPRGGRLLVTLGRCEHDELGRDCPFVRIRDTGFGMSPEIVPHIFEPFFTTKARGQGTGLGLAIVHGIVSEHGGKIEVESKVGAGTQFTVVFPPAAGAVSDPAARELEVPRGHGELILIAEDHEQLRRLFVSELSELGYEVIAAADGGALLQAWQDAGARVQALVLDVDLPKVSGLECLRTIRAQGGETPAVLVTGRVEVGPTAPADSHTRLLRKPFVMRELGLLVAALLEHRSAGECGR